MKPIYELGKTTYQYSWYMNSLLWFCKERIEDGPLAVMRYKTMFGKDYFLQVVLK